MISVDTNLLVRIVTNDDPGQARRASAAIAREQVSVSKTVLLELEWVLRHGYGLRRDAVLKSMRGILGLPNVQAEDALQVSKALDWHEKGLDFTDALHIASSEEGSTFVSFDEKLGKKAKKIGGIQVRVI